ncbi:MAG: HAD-IA family hydrolase [Bacteroides sp.]
MRYTTYIFDFDYTLADSSRGIVMCYRHVLTREGFLDVTDEQIKRTIGKTLEDSFSEMTGITDPQHLASMKQQYVQHADSCMTANTHLFPETREVLQQLKQQGARIAILSTKYRYRIEELAARDFPEGFFDLIVGGEDVRQMKPNPEGLLLAMERLGVTPAETLYLGDSVVDALTARAASVPFAGILHGVTTHRELAAYPHTAIYTDLYGLLEQCPTVPAQSLQQTAPSQGVTSRVPQAPKWVSWWKLPILYFLSSLAWDELTVEWGDFPLFQLLFLLTLWWTLHGRRFLPLALHERMMLQLQPLRRRMRRYYLCIQRGKAIPLNTAATTVCKCCGEIYQGNFCPRCGQPCTTSRYHMSNALKNIAGGFFNIDSGFGRTLIDLFYRPGHLIREFVTGRRAFYFRPFQMLFIMAAIYVMTVQLVDPDALRQEQLLLSEAITPEQKAKVKQVSDSVKQVVTYELEEEGINVRELTDLLTDEVGIPIVSEGKSNLLTGDNSLTNRFNRFVESHPFVKRVVDLLKGWFHGNKAFLVLITLPLFALATRFVFRKPRYRPRFNITEHLFVQAFIACQLLLVSIVVLLIHGHAQVDDLYEVSFPGIFLIFCFDYRQLYAISWWQSLWCTCKMFLFALLLIILLATLVVAVWFSFLFS